MANLYSLTAVQNLIDRYMEKDGQMWELIPGTLGYGLTVLSGEGLKTTIIKEVFINHWSNGHTIRLYNKMPKKYEEMIFKFENDVPFVVQGI